MHYADMSEELNTQRRQLSDLRVQADMLDDARHALAHGHLEVVDEFLERVSTHLLRLSKPKLTALMHEPSPFNTKENA